MSIMFELGHTLGILQALILQHVARVRNHVARVRNNVALVRNNLLDNRFGTAVRVPRVLHTI